MLHVGKFPFRQLLSGGKRQRVENWHRRSLRLCPFRYSGAGKKLLPFEADTDVPTDVVLFLCDNRRSIRLLNFFAVSQCVFWSYLSHFAFNTLRDVSQDKEEEGERLQESRKVTSPNSTDSTAVVSWWRRINLGENKYRYGITVLCASLGFGIFTGVLMFSLRSVRTLTLVKGGRIVRFMCSTPWGTSRVIDVPLTDITCNVCRDHVRSYLPVKVRRYSMYFLLDQSGTYTDTKLFDYTVGLKRF